MVLFGKLDVPWVLVLIAITEEFRIWDKSKLHVHMLPFTKILCLGLGVPSEDFLKWIWPSLQIHFAFSIHLLIKFYLQLTLSVTENITIKIILSESLWTQLVLHIVIVLRCVIMNGKKKMIWKNIWEKLHFVTNHSFTYHQIVTTKIMAKCVIIKKSVILFK